MSGRIGRGLLVATALLVVLHQDFWWWDDPRRVLGLPIGLTYHVAYCGVATALLALLVRRTLADDAE